VDWYKLTYDPEVRTSSINRAMLMMAAVRTSATLGTYTGTHGATTQQTANFIVTAVRT
jgi:hypothetical protein